ncbi:MipA/OmpV family protein [Aureimonas altamirensis]|uniref:MipA/OmpV family protein n=1 Tax=Aureimonas altamirensis TaxID=370622 RepID=UPI0030166925
MVVSFNSAPARLNAGLGAMLAIGLSSASAAAADRLAPQSPAPAEIAAAAEPHPSRFGRLSQKLGEWDVVIGGGARVEPEYEGADTFEVSAIPYISATFGEWLKIDQSGLEATLYSTEHLQFSGLVGYNSGRSEDDSDYLLGMGDVDEGATVGGRASLGLGIASLFLQGAQTIGGDEGFVGVAGIEVSHAVGRRLLLSAEASATVADGNHMQAYFGVDAAQSQRSGYEAYDAGAGLKRIDFSVAATAPLSENWFLRGEAGVGLLLGDAKDSPIVRDDVQPSGLLLVGYRF